MPRAVGAGGLERGTGGGHGVAESRSQAGDDAVARVSGVGVDLESSRRAQVRLYERLGLRETSPGAWPPRGYPRPGSAIMDLGSC
ncbi:hypothetical protein [Micrococcus luteus]|uniref:hypothetical protein n=1 Tax=Micrococcus luteus TaxID=1270 RepID=UPI0036C53CD4